MMANSMIEAVTIIKKRSASPLFCLESVKTECLDHFIVFGESHLRLMVSNYEEFYNSQRPHQGKDNLPLTGLPPPPLEPVNAADIDCDERLGGLLKHYRRRQAA